MRILQKIQKLPLRKRKFIFWAATAIIGLILAIIFIVVTANRLKNFQINSFQEDVRFPSLEPLESAFPK